MDNPRHPPGIGETIANIPLVSSKGVERNLHELIGPAGAVVYFMRSATCPICLAHVKRLAAFEVSEAWRGLPIIVIAPGGSEEAAEVARRQGVGSLSIWATLVGYAAMGLHIEMTMQQSGTFIVDSGAVVRHSRFATIPITSFGGSCVRTADAMARFYTMRG